jgi:hypothetical protein
MKKIFIVTLLCALILTGCGIAHRAYESPNDLDLPESGDVFDETQFFVKTVEYQECSEYFIYYRNPDGTETEITEIGVQESPYYIVNDRIYFAQGDSLISVNFTGGDKQYLYDNSAENISFNFIDSTDGEWLYCSGTKYREIHKNSDKFEAAHRVSVKTKVKADFSEFYET